MKRKFLSKRDIYFAVIFILSLLFVSTFFYGGQKVENEVTYGATTPTSTTSWTASSRYYDTSWSGSGTASSPYLITTPAELAGLAYRVDAGTTYSGKYFRQTANLNLIAHYWDPIGDYKSTASFLAFRGNYDGNNYTITNLIVSSTSDSTFPGLFSCVDGANIENVTISNSYINNYGGFGFVVGYAVDSTIENCHTTSSNQMNEVATQNFYIYVGGIVGWAENCIIKSCSNATDIVIPHIDNNSYTGGIVGYSEYTQILDCYNEGDVTCVGWLDDNHVTQTIGGICGTSGCTTINGCFNEGKIQGADNVGGIAGRINLRGSGVELASTINNCYNNGNITGPYTVGGIVGYAMADGPLYIVNCFNTAPIISETLHDSGDDGNAGGICGDSSCEVISIINCFNVCTLNYGFGGYTNNNSPNNTGCTKISNLNSTSYAKNRNWYASSSNWNNTYPWDFNNVWSISSSQNNGYPYLNIRAFTYTIRYNIPSQLELPPSAPTTAEFGEVIEIPSPTSTVEGVHFAGWTATNLNTAIAQYGSSINDVTTHWSNGNEMVNTRYFLNLANIGQTVTLTANVRVPNYTVNVVYGNGTSSRTISADFGKSFNLPVPVRTGYEFQGWKISGNYNLTSALQGSSSNPTLAWSSTTSLPTSTYFSNLAIVDGATVTLTAQWAPGRYDITYNVNSSDAEYVGLNYALSGEDISTTARGGALISYDSTYGIITIDGENNEPSEGAGLITTKLDYTPKSLIVGHYRVGGLIQNANFSSFMFTCNDTHDEPINDNRSSYFKYAYQYIEWNDFNASASTLTLNIWPHICIYDNTQYRVFAYDPNYSGDNTQQILYGDTPAMGYAIRPGYVFTQSPLTAMVEQVSLTEWT